MTRGLGMFDYTVPGMKDQQELRNSGQSSPIVRPIGTDSEVNELHLGTHPLGRLSCLSPYTTETNQLFNKINSMLIGQSQSSRAESHDVTQEVGTSS